MTDHWPPKPWPADGFAGPIPHGLYSDVPEAVYHADPCHVPSLSASIAKSPTQAHAYLRHPKLGGEPMKPSGEMDDGTIIHLLVLGKGADIAVLDFDSWRTKASKEARDLARAAGTTPVLAGKHARLMEAAEAIRARMKGMGIEIPASREVTMFWEQSGVQCRARLDSIEFDGTWFDVTDLKSTGEASPDGIARSIVNFGYDVQQAAYTDGLETLFPDHVGRVRYNHIFAELDPPHCVTPGKLSESFETMGRDKWTQAVSQWADSLQHDDWACYVREPVVFQPPYWELRRYYEGDETE